MRFTILSLILSISLGLVLTAPTYQDGIQNRNVERSIDLTSQLARHNLKIEVANKGSSATSDYYLTIQESLASHLAYLRVVDESKTVLKVGNPEKVDDKKNSYVAYRVELSKPLAASSTAKIEVSLVFSHVFTPYPASISQAEKQLVKYHGNHYFFSPYTTLSQSTTVKLASTTIESKTEEKPTTVKGDSINYGPYSDIPAFSVSNMNLHFENNKPFITVTHMTKEIEISHWGNVAVEETYDYLSHDGAKLKGTFSRFDYQRQYGRGSNVVAGLREILPHGASDVYYRDEIGNISTSHLFAGSEGVVLDLQPRYPLFGGWKIGFYLGYNLPTENFLFTDAKDASHYVLNMTFSSSMSDIVIDDLTVRVIFPEGSKNIEFYTPFAVDGSGFETHFTYLDTSGRPVLVLNKKNVVPEHNQYFQAVYTFSQSGLLQEPILLIGAFFAFFAFIMLYTRIPLSIGAPKGYTIYGGRVADILLKYKDVMDQRAELHAALDSTLATFSTTKSVSQYNADKKKPEAGLIEASKRAAVVLGEMDEANADLGKKLRDLERRESKKTTTQQQLHDNEVAYRTKKIITSVYENAKDELSRAYAQVDEEIQNVLSELTDSL